MRLEFAALFCLAVGAAHAQSPDFDTMKEGFRNQMTKEGFSSLQIDGIENVAELMTVHIACGESYMSLADNNEAVRFVSQKLDIPPNLLIDKAGIRAQIGVKRLDSDTKAKLVYCSIMRKAKERGWNDH